MAQCQGPCTHMVRLFLLFMCIWQEDVAKIPEVPGAPRNANPAREITWLVGVTIYCTFFNKISPPSRRLLRDEVL